MSSSVFASGSDRFVVVRPYQNSRPSAFETFDEELQTLIAEVHRCSILTAHERLTKTLGKARVIFQEEAKILGRNGTKEHYEHFKERIHAWYNQLAFPFIRRGSPSPLAEIAARSYSHLAGTLSSCREITEYAFDLGLAYHNLGIALIRLGDFEAGVSWIELASVEDAQIGHTTGAAGPVLQQIERDAWSACDGVVSKAATKLGPTETVVKSLINTERYRLLQIILRFNTQIKDYRGYLEKDTLERNLSNLARLTEHYLRRTRPKSDGNLVNLIQNAFDMKVFPWRRSWQDWKDTVTTHYYGPNEDGKISDILSDKTDLYEAKMFKLLCLLRNFTAHVFNDRSCIFDNYERVFEMCLAAFLYTANTIT